MIFSLRLFYFLCSNIKKLNLETKKLRKVDCSIHSIWKIVNLKSSRLALFLPAGISLVDINLLKNMNKSYQSCLYKVDFKVKSICVLNVNYRKLRNDIILFIFGLFAVAHELLKSVDPKTNQPNGVSS